MNLPILSSLILLPSIGALFLFFTKSKSENKITAKYVALFTSLVNFFLSIYLWFLFDQTTSAFQFVEDRIWIEGLINYKVGVDGISILFIILTTFITPLCIISVNNSVTKRLNEFLIAILVMETFMIGVFCSLDLVVFYLFFEAGLIPMFLIIGIWGGARRVYSAFKFFLFTLLGSVLMLVAIISIYWITGTTDVVQLYELGIDTKYQNLLWLAFFSSFAVKTPMWPVHTWLPDAHVEAPTAGSVLLASSIHSASRTSSFFSLLVSSSFFSALLGSFFGVGNVDLDSAFFVLSVTRNFWRSFQVFLSSLARSFSTILPSFKSS